MKIKQKNRGVDFLARYLGTLGSSLLRNIIEGKGVVATRKRKDGAVRAGTGGVIMAGVGVHGLILK